MSHTTVANRLPFPSAQLIKSNGQPADGWTYNFYLSGTDTLENVYTAVDLTGPTNAIELNEYGMPDVDIFLNPDVNYKLVIKDDTGVTIFTYNNVKDFARQAVAHFQVYAGNPNGNKAGTAGVVGGSPADVIFDTTNNAIWVCTTTGTAATAVWTNTAASLTGALVLSGVLSPASFSTRQDDYDPTDLATASTIRFNPGAESDITGIAGGSTGRELTLINTSSTYRVNLKNQNASSTTANRFLLPNSLDVALLPNYVCVITYDALTGRWRLKVPPFDLALGNAQYISNAAFSFSVDSNALTIALKTQRGNDPTPADPVVIAFRDTTVTAGNYVLRTVTAALSLVLSAGSSLGFAASESDMLHIGFIDNAGVPELAVSSNGALWTEDRLVSTTAEGGSGGADSKNVIYSTTARSNLACRLACVAIITTDGTAGNWTSIPTRATMVTGNPAWPFKNSAKMWVNFKGTGTIAISDDFNVSSLTDNGSGDYTINVGVAVQNANYSVGGTARASGHTTANGSQTLEIDSGNAPTTSALRIWTKINTGVVDALAAHASILSM